MVTNLTFFATGTFSSFFKLLITNYLRFISKYVCRDRYRNRELNKNVFDFAPGCGFI